MTCSSDQQGNGGGHPGRVRWPLSSFLECRRPYHLCCSFLILGNHTSETIASNDVTAHSIWSDERNKPTWSSPALRSDIVPRSTPQYSPHMFSHLRASVDPTQRVFIQGASSTKNVDPKKHKNPLYSSTKTTAEMSHLSERPYRSLISRGLKGACHSGGTYCTLRERAMERYKLRTSSP